MSHFEYSGSELTIRPDLAPAYRKTWDWLAAPGAWWTGAERVAIAAEMRAAADCSLCRERKAALSPFSIDGAHDQVGSSLPDVAVDTAHRLRTDAARLSQSWVEKNRASSLSDGPYVELLGVVVCVLSIDSFHEALGLPLEPLPEPREGEPSGYRPAGAETGIGWIEMIQDGSAGAAEQDIFPGARIPNVLRAMSLVPDCVRELQSLSTVQYVPVHQVADVAADPGRALERTQIELVAGRVSALNECFY